LSVYVIYDSFGSLATDRQMFRKMRRSGVKLQQFHPMRPWECKFGWRPANRDHRKLLLIDDDIAGVGGLNVGREYAGSWVISGSASPKDCDFWRDNAIGIKGPSARPFLRSFARTWHYITHGGRIRGAEFMYNLESLPNSSDRRELSILASVPTLSSPLRGVLGTLFRDATKSIQMTMAYFAPDDDLINELCRAAKRRVRVQLMLPGRTDVHLLTIAARSFYEKLMTNGVEIYERQAVVLHAKTMTIDGRLTVIGSTNLDYRSIEYNLELSAIVRSQEFGAQMHKLFANDMRYSKQISLKEWRRRPNIDRFVQWAVSRARYLL
jgi:cardiolipin synthase